MSANGMTNTARLVEQARNLDSPLQEQHLAFTQLVEESQHLVFGLALTLLRDIDDAKDATQEAYATAWLRLRQLRDPSAFPTWVKTIVAKQCARRRRPRTRRPEDVELPYPVEPDTSGVDYQSLIVPALATLPDGERDITVLFYFLRYSQPEIARMLRLRPGTVAKRLHSARLRLRRQLPPSVRRDFVRVTPSTAFTTKVRLGIYDEYVGEYYFADRPDVPLLITREGDTLVSTSNGQRHVLAALGDASLVTAHYDGEGRFGRSRRGEITHFTYYEFGRRLGVAWKRERAR